MLALIAALVRTTLEHARLHLAPSHVCLFDVECWQDRHQFGAPLRVHWRSGRFVTVVPGRPLPAGTPVTVVTPPDWLVARRFVDVCADLEQFDLTQHDTGQVTVFATCGCGTTASATAPSRHAAVRRCLAWFAGQPHRPVAWSGTSQERDSRARAAADPNAR